MKNHVAVLIGAGLLICNVLSASGSDRQEMIEQNRDTLIRTKACVQCDLSGTDLNRLDLSGADLRGADLSGTSLFLADLSEADLSGAILRGAKFGGADLAGANLSGADLRGVRLDGAYTVGMILDGAFVEKESIDEETQLKTVETVFVPEKDKPKKTLERQDVVVGDRIDINGVEEQSPELMPADEAAASLETAPGKPANEMREPVKTVTPVPPATIIETPGAETSQEENKEDTRPDNADRESSRPGPSATQEHVAEAAPARTLTIAGPEGQAQTTEPGPDDDKGGVLVAAAPTASRAEEKAGMAAPADEAVTDLKEKQEVTIVEQEIETEPQRQVEEISQEANAAAQEDSTGGETPGAIAADIGVPDEQDDIDRFVEQLLETNRCYGCNLRGADLAGQDLDGADLEGADLSGANLFGTEMRGANLKGANLQSANVQQADLRQADLYKADLSNANLSGADLKEAQLDDAILAGVVGHPETAE